MVAKVTYLGTATLILQIGGTDPIRIMTDPALDAAGKQYPFGFGASSRKTLSPSLPSSGIRDIDLVLLSHDEHADNLDEAGRAFLPKAGKVFTTVTGAARLRGELDGKVDGLEPWETRLIRSREGWNLTVTAVPAKHGQFPLPEHVVGETIGFVLRWPGQVHGALYISGDTVFFDGIKEIGRQFRIGTAFLHLGGVRFPVSGPLRYTFNGREAAKTAELLGAGTIVPIHYDGWTHFRESLDRSERAFEKLNLKSRLLHLPRGQTVEMTF